jgi:hypothetical protein
VLLTLIASAKTLAPFGPKFIFEQLTENQQRIILALVLTHSNSVFVFIFATSLFLEGAVPISRLFVGGRRFPGIFPESAAAGDAESK